MTHLLLGGISGWGKSINGQSWMEENLEKFDYAAILDHKDEYRGLVKSDMAKWMGVGDKESNLSVEAWRRLFDDNPKLVLARKGLRREEWAEVANRIARFIREADGTGLLVVDEAHFVASQKYGTPEELAGVASTGRGEGVSSIWITQRLQKADEDVISQCNERILGGFTSDADRSKIDVEYPDALHNPERTRPVPAAKVPDELLVDGEGIPLRRWTDEDGKTIGSEWIYSNDRGERERLDTRGLPDRMKTTHYGPEGQHLDMPEYK